jgi:hypothetical protein
MAKLSKTAQWMLDHPDDIPPPKSGGGARAWRIARGLDGEWGRFKRDQRALAKSNRESHESAQGLTSEGSGSCGYRTTEAS